LEEFITRDLIINEATDVPTFDPIEDEVGLILQSNNILAQKTRGWTCGEDESCADHIIFFEIESTKVSGIATCHPGKQYLTKTDKWGTFVNKLAKNLLGNFNCRSNTNDLTSYSALSKRSDFAPTQHTQVYFRHNSSL
jgi:hypothetical protein